MKDKKAQIESGSLQTLFITLVLVAGAGALMFSFYQPVATNYAVSFSEESEFTYYQETFSETENATRDFRQILERNDLSVLDVASSAISNGYNLVKSFIVVPPRIFFGIVSNLVTSLGVPPIVASMIYTILVAIIIFAVVALLLKVRG